MKLIDILVEELPKRGGWPDGANYCHSMYENIYFSVNKPEPAPNGRLNSKDGDLEVNQPLLCKVFASGAGVEEVTREQYEAALATKNEGWIEWGGGKHPPVSTNTAVDVKFEKGYVQSGYPAGEYSWEHVWQGSNIIAYRLHKPQEAEQAKADDESDLNECIGQGVAPVWNGEGLPPVGCECERSWCGDEWQPCKMLFASNQIVVVKLKESGIEDAYNIGEVTFRTASPIRSEAERKRDEAVKTIMLTGWCQAAAEEIYDLVAAGKVPGVKLED